MSNPKTYDIRSVDDLAKVATSDNLERLMIDLRGWLLIVITARHLAEADGIDLDVGYRCTNFHWIDDGKHDIHTTISENPWAPATHKPETGSLTMTATIG